MSPTTILVTGAGRGIGSGLVASLLLRPSSTVIAAVRDPPKGPAQALLDLPKGEGSKIIVVKIDSSAETDPAEAVSTLQRDHSIDALDVVIANAGIAHSSGPVIKTSTTAIRDHFAVNTIGPLLLFQATAPLLKASKTGRPVFVAVTSMLGTISGMESLESLPPALSPYGASKAALNWFIRRLHFEETWLTSFVLHPGTVATDMVNSVIEGTDLKLEDLGAITVEQSVSNIVQRVDTASRDVSGTFQNHDGTHLPW
ncbi:short-chain dehydrogenase [Colletotrichum scovillei]|uniref:Short-chain dehydrogenase n=1 Tax=Colletotrichum scovillei TaxID=1209932 RepID=A0A9P7R5I4_9PEZI|nr:short-chain dehydrogenase [Colletotrichum scovillei]KAG7065360.1 short-chain dehydrogenase [Colletotrichum scovillei]KAG7067962.1 short-chain dehydrogenase [Colletotrichum scovillei]